jgi:hypothetical protein
MNQEVINMDLLLYKVFELGRKFERHEKGALEEYKELKKNTLASLDPLEEAQE